MISETGKAQNAHERRLPRPQRSQSRACHPLSLRPMMSPSPSPSMVHEDREQLLEASATRNPLKSPRSRSLKSPRRAPAGKSDLTGAKEMVSVFHSTKEGHWPSLLTLSIQNPRMTLGPQRRLQHRPLLLLLLLLPSPSRPNQAQIRPLPKNQRPRGHRHGNPDDLQLDAAVALDATSTARTER